MELYFKVKLWGLAILACIFLIIVLWAITKTILNDIKDKMMLKAGFTYSEGAIFAPQPHYKRGNLQINANNVYIKSFSEIRRWIKENQE